jgi:hypothetical protein
MNPKQKFPWRMIVLGIGCICALCVGVLVVGGIFYTYTRNTSTPSVIDAVNTLPPAITVQPVQTSIPILPEPTSTSTPTPVPSGPTLTGDQQLDEFYLYDDFSSEALGWPVFDDGTTILQYENGQYSFQVAEPDYYDWAYTPVDFPATDIWFDVQGLSGEQNGTFGVFCQFLDEDNYYYVEFDLGTRSYLIGEIINGEQIYLTSENDEGNNWQDTSVLKSNPSSVNRIGISCYLDIITLFINDEWMTDVSVTTPFDTSGEMAFFVYAFDFADADGYKVFFDNVEIYTPQQ